MSSRTIQLEQMVGAPLFVRNAKSDVTPTQARWILYQTAISIDGLWRDTRGQIVRMQEARESLAVSLLRTTAAILLPRTLSATARDMDSFDFAVYVMNSDVILEQVSMKAVQLGVTEEPIVNGLVDRVTPYGNRLVLAGEPDGVRIVCEHGSGVRYYTDLCFKTVQVVPVCTMEVSSNAATMTALSAGFGQSLIPEAAVPAGVLVQRELGNEFVRRFYALVPRSGLTHDQQELARTTIVALRG